MSASDPEASRFTTLYRDHHGWLYHWLRRRLGCTEQAADLAQDTFVRVLARGEPVTGTAPRAFLGTIARGLVIDFWRRSALEKAYLEALAQLPPRTCPSAEARHEALQMLERTAAMLDGLKPRVRQAFLLHQLGGRTHRQVAEALGVSTRSAERYVAEALMHCYRLRYQLEEG
ncbi:sigma-70 family RNA polymerase sigma factor [Alloalcanivorax sp. C16-2]|uniref:sigma-70 family RNA polymerase sigma factor n=1 Tax=Alloalcanivorax TaxID=3020832 RepID=UPI001931E279|nr:sigma-70 family RNA polymerase sigma factor [Alloalcanivorax marinus]MBL7250064.1 sigma-70 family RNA polymerase sigma factor [Alloalcanivorax marinus]